MPGAELGVLVTSARFPAAAAAADAQGVERRLAPCDRRSWPAGMCQAAAGPEGPCGRGPGNTGRIERKDGCGHVGPLARGLREIRAGVPQTSPCPPRSVRNQPADNLDQTWPGRESGEIHLAFINPRTRRTPGQSRRPPTRPPALAGRRRTGPRPRATRFRGPWQRRPATPGPGPPRRPDAALVPRAPKSCTFAMAWVATRTWSQADRPLRPWPRSPACPDHTPKPGPRTTPPLPLNRPTLSGRRRPVPTAGEYSSRNSAFRPHDPASPARTARASTRSRRPLPNRRTAGPTAN